MSHVEVKCPQCGKMTKVGRLVCQHCSGKLEGIKPGDLRKAKPSKGGRPGSSASGAANALNAVLKLVVALVIIGAVGLMVWAGPDVGEPGEASDAENAQKKIQYLHEGVENSRSAKTTITEPEINAYFEKLLGDNSDATEGGGMTMALQKMGVDVLADRIQVVLRSKAGPATLTWECSFEPGVTGGFADPELLSARIGHLPMPGPLKAFVGGKIGSMFGDMPMEKKIWNNLAKFEVSDGQVMVETRVAE